MPVLVISNSHIVCLWWLVGNLNVAPSPLCPPCVHLHGKWAQPFPIFLPPFRFRVLPCIIGWLSKNVLLVSKLTIQIVEGQVSALLDWINQLRCQNLWLCDRLILKFNIALSDNWPEMYCIPVLNVNWRMKKWGRDWNGANPSPTSHNILPGD